MADDGKGPARRRPPHCLILCPVASRQTIGTSDICGASWKPTTTGFPLGRHRPAAAGSYQRQPRRGVSVSDGLFPFERGCGANPSTDVVCGAVHETPVAIAHLRVTFSRRHDPLMACRRRRELAVGERAPETPEYLVEVVRPAMLAWRRCLGIEATDRRVGRLNEGRSARRALGARSISASISPSRRRASLSASIQGGAAPAPVSMASRI
jgi:hypothetical protein